MAPSHNERASAIVPMQVQYGLGTSHSSLKVFPKTFSVTVNVVVNFAHVFGKIQWWEPGFDMRILYTIALVKPLDHAVSLFNSDLYLCFIKQIMFCYNEKGWNPVSIICIFLFLLSCQSLKDYLEWNSLCDKYTFGRRFSI